MSVNKHLPHVFVLPEDDANRQLANGFQLVAGLDIRRIQILEEAGGWREVVNRFKSDHVPQMRRFISRFMVLLLDFDGRADRVMEVTAEIPEEVRERVFVLGALGNPEGLRTEFGSSYETIGEAAAKDCRDGGNATWAHNLLCHNAGELERLRRHVRPILFSNS